MRDLIASASIVDFIAEANGSAALDGASLELRSELLGDEPSYMPLEMLPFRRRRGASGRRGHQHRLGNSGLPNAHHGQGIRTVRGRISGCQFP